MENSKKSNRSDESARGNDSSSKARKGKRKTLRVTSFPQSLPPEVAAQYLSQATAAAAAAWEKNSTSSSANQESSSSSGSRPFGPSRPPPSASSVSFGSLDLAALAQSGSLDFATAAAAASRSTSSGENGGGGPPCSEAEMKALMSMFVEIMGMSMDADSSSGSGSNNRKTRSKSVTQAAKSFLASGSSGDSGSYPVFMFGESGSDVPPPPGGWPSSAAAAAVAAAAGMNEGFGNYYNDSDDDDDDDDSMPDLDEGPGPGQGKHSFDEDETPTKDDANKDGTEFSPAVLAALEQVEMDDALQEEERAKKAAKKREKKQRKKEKQKKEAALKALQAAQKKREKLVLSWRSRVVTACQSNEVSKLDSLLGESPLRPPKTHEETEEETQAFIRTHMEYLLPNCIAKSRQAVEKGREARQKLTSFMMNWSAQLVFNCGRNGRAAIHTACFNGDSYFAQFVLERAASARSEDSSILPESYRTTECDDSGWAPLHYAVVSGSNQVVEVLLKEGCDWQKLTDESKTWRISNGKGITARELAEIVRAGKHDKMLESHGDALVDMAEAHLENSNERSRFQRVLEKIVDRLIDVEKNGYTPLPDVIPDTENNSESKEESNLPNRTSLSEDASKKKKKKKKKEKNTQAENEPAKKPATSNPVPAVQKEEDDPMIAALLGMGFSSEQISAAAKACGGVERATADDLVMWIFSQESGEPAPAPPASTEDADANEKEKANEAEEAPFTDPAALQEKKKKAQEQRDQAAAIAQQNLLEASKREEESRIAAQKLAAKREEQRRRNREWNNREQARQREEAQAKLTQEMERRARAEAQRVATNGMVGAQPAQLVTGTNAPNVGVPQQVAYASTASPPVLPAAMDQQPVMSQQQQPPQIGAPTHLLQSNGRIRPVGGYSLGGVQHPPQDRHPKSPYPAEVRQGGFSHQMGAPPVPGIAMNGPMMSNAPPGYSSSFVKPYESRPIMRGEMQGEYSQIGNELYADPRLSMIPPEDGTVSSAGSGRPPRDIRVNMVPSTHSGPPIMSLSSSTPPPGFRPSASVPNTPTGPDVVEEDNPLGEIRATAKAFIPTSFKPDSSHNAKGASAPSPSPAVFLRPSSGISRSASDIGVHGYGGTTSSDPSMLDPVSSLLGGMGGLSSGSSSLLPATSTRLTGAVDHSPVPSAASSVTGAPSGSSLLDSVPLGTSTSVGGIWGIASTSNAGSVGAPVGGFQSFGLGDPTSSIGSLHTARSFGALDNVFSDPSKENGGGAESWGTGGKSGDRNPSGLGSIW